jgi:7-cyano-7-deazaguanine reductase
MSDEKNVKSDAENLKLLGNHATTYKDTYAPEVLEAFNNKFPAQDYVVELECPEFTSNCPKTGQPDFANITIKYAPDKKLVESKSLKLYLFSFRREGSFHEDCINKICRDLYELMEPKWIEVRGDFTPRGGISINPTAQKIKEGFTGKEGIPNAFQK